MTKLEVEIKNPKPVSTKAELDGAYLAKFHSEDDRILIYSHGRLTGVIECQGYLNNFVLQLKQTPENYTELKRIKRMTIEVEIG